MPVLLPDGNMLALHAGRCDERQRHQRVRLPAKPSDAELAPLVDVLVRELDAPDFQFTGLSVQQWLARRPLGLAEAHFLDWYRSELQRPALHARLSCLPRQPDNHYCVELDRPPLMPSLPGRVEALGLRQATAQHWLGALRALCGQGLKPEELEASGVLDRLAYLPPATRLQTQEVLERIRLRHVVPRFATESRFGYVAAAPWRPWCQRIPPSEYRRRGLIGQGREALHIIRYRHPSLAWSIVRTRYQDLLTPLSDGWSVLDERGKFIQQPLLGFASPEAAMDYAEYRMSQRFAHWGQSQPSTQWQQYALPGGVGYREILLQLHDWVPNYQPRHFRTRNVLVHLRLSIRKVEDGRWVLFLDEVQSDWHADLHAARQQDADEGQRIANAPFRNEWPLLALKLMLWWAQRQGCQGLAWSTADLQDARWGAYGPPLLLYRKLLPDAAARLAKTLGLDLDETRLSIRSPSRRVRWSEQGWRVCTGHGIPVTKPFRRQEQAERFADLTGVFEWTTVPVLWLEGLERIQSIPLFGTGTQAEWLSPPARAALTGNP